MMSKVYAIRGIFMAWGGYLAALLVTYFVTPVLVQGLGDASYGMWSVLTSLAGLYTLLAVGHGNATTKFLAQFHAQDDTASEQKVVATGMAISAALAALVVAVSLIVAWCFPAVFGTGEEAAGTIRWVATLAGLTVAAELAAQVFQSGIAARGRFDLANLLTVGCRVGIALVTASVVLAGGGLLEMSYSWLAVRSLFTLITVVVAVRCVALPLAPIRGLDAGVGRTLFSFGLLALIPQAVRRLSMFGGCIIVGAFAGPVAVAYYSVAESLMRRGLTLGKAVNQVVMPISSQFDVRQNRGGLQRLLILAQRVLLSVSLLFTIVCVVQAKTFIRYWINADYAEGTYAVLCVLALSQLVKLPGNAHHATLMGVGQVAFLGRLSAVEGVATILLGIAGVIYFGPVGMAVAMLLAQLFTSGIVLPVYTCRCLGFSLTKVLRRSFAPALAASVPALLAAVALNQLFPPQRILSSIAQILATVLVGAIAAFFICLDRRQRGDAMAAVLPRFATLRPPVTQPEKG